MYERDRLTSLALLAGALLAWAGVVYVLFNHDPVGNPAVLLGGALAMGGAAALTLAPLFWLIGFARTRRIAYRGDWWRAARRAVLVGLLVTLFVILLGQSMLSLPLALFVVSMAVLVEMTLSLRR